MGLFNYISKVFNSTGTGYSHQMGDQKRSMKSWHYRSGSPKRDIDLNHQELMEKARDLYYIYPIANGAIKTIRTNVVGTGLKCMPTIDADYLGMTDDQAAEWESNTLRYFNAWAESTACDVERANNFYELQQLAFISWLMNGDVFALLPYMQNKHDIFGIKVQLIEADRVRNPDNKRLDDNIIEGIERNEHGKKIAVHICSQYPYESEYGKKKTWTRVEFFGRSTGRRMVLHCMANERIAQSRGVPLLSPVIEELKQLSRYSESEIQAAVVSSLFTGFVTKESVSDDKPIGEINDYEDGYDEREGEIALGSGDIIELMPGEKIEFANPTRPNTGLEQFINAVCTQIGSALELPVEVLLKKFTKSYSASRGALIEAWKTFNMYRSWMVNDFCQPIYEEWLTEAVSKGFISAPGFNTDPMIKRAYCGCRWNGPSQGSLDPVKEVQAAVMRVENGFSTRQQETTELGTGDFFQNNRQRIREEKARSPIAKQTINNEEEVSEEDDGED